MADPNAIYDKMLQSNASKVHAGLETAAQAEQRSEHNALNSPVPLTSLIPMGTQRVVIPIPVDDLPRSRTFR
jgi:hypothetical protein